MHFVPALNFVEATGQKLSENMDKSVRLSAIRGSREVLDTIASQVVFKVTFSRAKMHGNLIHVAAKDVQHRFPEMTIVTQKSEFVA